MRRYGLIGYPLSHSFSPGYFAAKFKRENISDTRYDAYPLEDISMVTDLIDSGIAGLNVTIPYKEKIIPYLHHLSDDAAQIKAVNTVKIQDGIYTGYNTDVIGFRQSLEASIVDKHPKKALVLGSGGACKAICFVLSKLDIEYKIVSRRSAFNYENLSPEIIREHTLIVNTTPLGMYPRDKEAPDLPYQGIGSQHILFDLIYNPEKTLFLKYGEEQGATIQNGLEMLHLQAEASWHIWQNEIT